MLVERREAGRVFGVGDGEIVGMKDDELGIGRISEALRDGFGLGGKADSKSEQKDKKTHEGSFANRGQRSTWRAGRGFARIFTDKAWAKGKTTSTTETLRHRESLGKRPRQRAATDFADEPG